MKLSFTVILGAMAAMAAAQNCWDSSFSWNPARGRGHCAMEGANCVCEGCDQVCNTPPLPSQPVRNNTTIHIQALYSR
ncbi:hypothetical protein Cob_v007966 [Colletotrichum orbiculare MAFF 240422]|uniref:Uncharacterized protein n=1 Tax=Colletotrichum orbiculare (strain 104-T / ATCC 96160 / CBS 514.97 / LARS 414 / MAFF 240422) TaxID=1213857 RepID=A0A484FMW4_COLOR|nr:hypothetical protein Cob_v007966 [Colletotrichum orbiculare MAFF 240422]